MKKWDVVVVGHTFIDFIFTGLPEWPAPGEEVFARAMTRDMGGMTITACGLGRLGRKVALLTCVGEDDLEWFRNGLQARGVDVSLVRSSRQPTAVTFAVSTTQERSFFTFSGANAELSVCLNDVNVREALKEARVVHMAVLPESRTAKSLLPELRSVGCVISVDLGGDNDLMKDSRVVELLPHVDFFMQNEKEARAISGQTECGEMLKWIISQGANSAVIKRGPRGAVMLTRGRFYEAPGFDVDAVDTTGAGDCFDAGFLHSMLAFESPRDWLRLGNLCGALSTRAGGGIAGFPTLEELEEVR